MHLGESPTDTSDQRGIFRSGDDEANLNAVVPNNHLDVVHRCLLMNAVEDGYAVNGVSIIKGDHIIHAAH